MVDPDSDHVDAPSVRHVIEGRRLTVALPSESCWSLGLMAADQIFADDTDAHIGDSSLLLS